MELLFLRPRLPAKRRMATIRMQFSGGIGGPSEDYPTRFDAIIAINVYEIGLIKGAKLGSMSASVHFPRRDRGETGGA